jgi:hypothetical protein
MSTDPVMTGLKDWDGTEAIAAAQAAAIPAGMLIPDVFMYVISRLSSSSALAYFFRK